MYFLSIFLALFFFESSHGFAKKKSPPSTAQSSVIVEPIIEGELNYTFECKNCSTSEAKSISEMEIELNKFIFTKCFEDRMTLPQYRSKMIETNGLTQSQVVEKIRVSSIKKIPIYFYWSYKNVVGYTNIGKPEIYLNRRYRRLSWWNKTNEVSNALHEVSHKLGFSHSYYATKDRPYSVPYSINFAVEDCLK